MDCYLRLFFFPLCLLCTAWNEASLSVLKTRRLFEEPLSNQEFRDGSFARTDSFFSDASRKRIRMEDEEKLEGSSNDGAELENLRDIFGEKALKIVFDDWTFDGVRNEKWRKSSLRFGNGLVFAGAGYDLAHSSMQSSVGALDTVVNAYHNEAIQETAVSVVKGDFGVSIDRGNLQRASAADIHTRRVRTSSLVNLHDRDYGQRIKVRHFDMMVRHDFDEMIYPDKNEFATEFYVKYRGVGVSTMTDRGAMSASVGFDYRGNNVLVIRDLDDAKGYVRVIAGKGWQMISSVDIPNEKNREAWARIGFGKIGRFYGRFGAGIGNDGIPEGGVELQTSELGFSTDFVDVSNQRIFTNTLTLGRFAYSWESEVFLDQLLQFPVPALGIFSPRRLQQCHVHAWCSLP